MRLDKLAEILECELSGDGAPEIIGVATLESAQEGHVSFLANTKYAPAAKKSKASAIIAAPEVVSFGISLLKNSNPYLIFAKAIEIFHKPSPQRASIHPSAWVSDTATIGRGVSIGAFTFVGDKVIIEDGVSIGPNCSIENQATLGEHSIIHSGAVIRRGVRVGKRCIIQANSVIGSDGFGFAKTSGGEWHRIIQAGDVVLGDDVDVGACTTIDRATLGETRVESGAKLDNLVQVGHACFVGPNSLLCAQVGLAGSTKIGAGVILAGQVGSAGHLHVGDGAVVTAQSGVGSDVEPGKVVSGSPSFDNKRWLRATASFTRLPDIHKAVKELEKRVSQLENISQAPPENS